MKKHTHYTIMIALAAGSILSACESKEAKVQDAKENVQKAHQELKEAEKSLNAEYPAFKTDADIRIAENEKKIARLREELSRPGTHPLDGARKRKIDQLEQRNADLRSRLYGYEKERSDWESFKREFNHDVAGVGNSFDDLGKDNVK